MDNKNKNFCAYCGRELKLIDSKYFDTKTGKKKKKIESCPIKDCAHGYHNFPKFRFISYKCKICGKEYIAEMY